jgi:hypothetical protein
MWTMTRASLAARPIRRGSAKPRHPIRGGAAITLLYLRPEGAAETELDARLREVALRYAPVVALEIRPLAEAGRLARWTSPGSPAVLVLRRGVVIGEAMGHDLPVRELDRAVRRAVEWPAPRR